MAVMLNITDAVNGLSFPHPLSLPILPCTIKALHSRYPWLPLGIHVVMLCTYNRSIVAVVVSHMMPSIRVIYWTPAGS